MDANCVFDSVTNTYTCNAGNIYVIGAVALQSGENVIITATNDFVINTGASLTSNAGNGQVGGYLDINANSIKIQGTLLSSGGVCTGNRDYTCVEGGGGDISVIANAVDVSGEVSSKGNDGYCNYYPCTIKGGDAGKIDIQASNTIGVTGIVSANGGTTQGCDNFPGNGGIVNLFTNSIDIAGSVSTKGGSSTGIISWCGSFRSPPSGIITINANDITLHGEVLLNGGNGANIAAGYANGGQGGTLDIKAKNAAIYDAIINAFGGDGSSPSNYYWDPTLDYGGAGGNVIIQSDQLSLGTNSINVFGGAAYGRREGTIRYPPDGSEYGGDGGKIEIETLSILAPAGTYYAYGGKAYTRDGTAVDGNPGTISIKAGGLDGSGATFNPDAVFTPNDITPPTTTDDSHSTWQKADFNVALTCTDNPGGSGCKETFSRIDRGEWQTGNSIHISAEGDHAIDYYSVDIAGNIEPAKSIHAKLDKTAPTITINTPVSYGLYTVGTALSFSASDAPSGLDGAVIGLLTDIDGITSSISTGFVPSPGVYTLVVEATDKAGNIAHSDSRFFVVYDPTGGFATGGGWLLPDSESTLPGGRANFGFVAKYKNVGSTGNLEFQYKDADINLKSTSIDWLTITGVSAIFQGTGTINGTGTYTFRVNAKDNAEPGANVDSFDIRIWEGTGTDTEPIHKAKNVISGGNIVVHRK